MKNKKLPTRDEVWAKYKLIDDPAWSEYWRIHNQALAKYEHIHRRAWAECWRTLALIEKAKRGK